MSACEVRHLIAGPAAAPTVVLVNSLGTDLSMWDAQAAALEATHRVVRYDCRGHGASPLPDGPYDVADLGADLVALLDRLELGRASICGVSLGGATALWLAAHVPERIERVAACFSAARFATPDHWHQRAALVRERGLEAIADAVVGRWLTAAAATTKPGLVARLRRMLLATSAAGYAWTCEALARLDLSRDLAAIAVPTLVVAGVEDAATPPARSRELAAAVPGARFAEIPGAAHLGNLERPEPFNALLLEHLAATAAAGSGVGR